jgi:hypothetical protein
LDLTVNKKVSSDSPAEFFAGGYGPPGEPGPPGPQGPPGELSDAHTCACRGKLPRKSIHQHFSLLPRLAFSDALHRAGGYGPPGTDGKLNFRQLYDPP